MSSIEGQPNPHNERVARALNQARIGSLERAIEKYRGVNGNKEDDTLRGLQDERNRLQQQLQGESSNYQANRTAVADNISSTETQTKPSKKRGVISSNGSNKSLEEWVEGRKSNRSAYIQKRKARQSYQQSRDLTRRLRHLVEQSTHHENGNGNGHNGNGHNGNGHNGNGHNGNGHNGNGHHTEALRHTAPVVTTPEPAPASEPVTTPQTVRPITERYANKTDVRAAQAELDRARENYIIARKRARGFWNNLRGNVAALLRRGERPDQVMARERENYDLVRNQYLSNILDKEVGSATFEQEALGDNFASLVTAEMEKFQQEEIRLVREHMRNHARLSALYRHPWLRFATGTSLNIAIPASVAVGQLWLTAPLVAAKYGLQTVGTEGLLHGSMDLHSSKLGARSRRNQNLNNSIASIEEDQILKNSTEQHQAVNQENYLDYASVLKNRIDYALTRSQEGGEVNWRNLYQEQISGLEISKEKDNALIWHRRARASRWTVAALTSTLFMWKPVSLFHDVKIPWFGQTASGMPNQIDISYGSEDHIYKEALNNGHISSRYGTEQALIAKHIFGIQDFNPWDASADSKNGILEFHKHWDKNPKLYESIAQAIDKAWVASAPVEAFKVVGTSGNVYEGLVQHRDASGEVFKYSFNLNGILDNVTTAAPLKRPINIDALTSKGLQAS